MRYIKFRAWDGHEMCKLDLQNRKNILRVIDLECEGLQLMQFTGLTDKNGKEIYEGDIVEILTNYLKVEIKHIGKIVFESGAFIVGSETITDKYITFIELDEDWEIEVIGNIHENG